MTYAMESSDPYPKSVWAYDAFLARHIDPDGEASYGCPSCGWIPEIIDCHAEFVVRTTHPSSTIHVVHFLLQSIQNQS